MSIVDSQIMLKKYFEQKKNKKRWIDGKDEVGTLVYIVYNTTGSLSLSLSLFLPPLSGPLN